MVFHMAGLTWFIRVWTSENKFESDKPRETNVTIYLPMRVGRIELFHNGHGLLGSHLVHHLKLLRTARSSFHSRSSALSNCRSAYPMLLRLALTKSYRVFLSIWKYQFHLLIPLSISIIQLPIRLFSMRCRRDRRRTGSRKYSHPCCDPVLVSRALLFWLEISFYNNLSVFLKSRTHSSSVYSLSQPLPMQCSFPSWSAKICPFGQCHHLTSLILLFLQGLCCKNAAWVVVAPKGIASCTKAPSVGSLKIKRYSIPVPLFLRLV